MRARTRASTVRRPGTLKRGNRRTEVRGAPVVMACIVHCVKTTLGHLPSAFLAGNLHDLAGSQYRPPTHRPPGILIGRHRRRVRTRASTVQRGSATVDRGGGTQVLACIVHCVKIHSAICRPPPRGRLTFPPASCWPQPPPSSLPSSPLPPHPLPLPPPPFLLPSSPMPPPSLFRSSPFPFAVSLTPQPSPFVFGMEGGF